MTNGCRTALLLLAPLLLLPASRSGAASPWTVRLHGAWVRPAADFHLAGDNPDRVDAAVADGGGLLGGLEYRFTPRLGVDLAAMSARLDTTLSLSPQSLGTQRATDTLDFQAWLLGLDLHLTPARRFDLYLGPRAARVRYGDATFNYPAIGFRTRYAIGNDRAWGGFLGLDVPRGRWSLGFGLLYLSTAAEPRGVDAKLTLDPLVATAGAGYRF
jgi:hypothetical protein